MKSYKTIFNVANSVCEMFNLKMVRLDIQSFKMGTIEGYVGYLDTDDGKTIIIRTDGTFEYR